MAGESRQPQPDVIQAAHMGFDANFNSLLDAQAAGERSLFAPTGIHSPKAERDARLKSPSQSAAEQVLRDAAGTDAIEGRSGADALRAQAAAMTPEQRAAWHEAMYEVEVGETLGEPWSEEE